MKTFAIFTVVIIVGFLAYGVFTVLSPHAYKDWYTGLLMLGFGLITLVYALVSISFMSKSRRWRRSRSGMM